MSVFKIKVIKNYQLEQNKLEVGMNVELVCFLPSPTIYHGLYINQAFMKKYGFDLKGIGWNTTEFMEIEELDNTKLENLTKEIELIKVEKSDLVFAQRFEDVAQLRDREKQLLEKLETLNKTKNTMKQKTKFATEQEVNELFINSNKIIEEIENIETGNSEIWPIADGIINVHEYAKAKYKILWILKEPWDETDGETPAGGGWNNAYALNQKMSGKEFGSDSKTYFPIIYTAFGILNNYCLWNDMEDADKSLEVFNALKSIAVINVKKTPGFKNTPKINLTTAYSQYRELLLKQIEVYNPDIIIGGSTLNLFYEDLLVDKTKLTHNKSINFYQTEDRIYIDAYHPSQWAQVDRAEYCDDIILTVKELMS
jgi:hypothetical protein